MMSDEEELVEPDVLWPGDAPALSLGNRFAPLVIEEPEETREE